MFNAFAPAFGVRPIARLYARAEIKRVKQKLNEIMVLSERAKAGDIKLNFDQKHKIGRKKEFDRLLKALRKAEEDGLSPDEHASAERTSPPVRAEASREAPVKESAAKNVGGAAPAKQQPKPAVPAPTVVAKKDLGATNSAVSVSSNRAASDAKPKPTAEQPALKVTLLPRRLCCSRTDGPRVHRRARQYTVPKCTRTVPIAGTSCGAGGR